MANVVEMVSLLKDVIVAKLTMVLTVVRSSYCHRFVLSVLYLSLDDVSWLQSVLLLCFSRKLN